VSNWHYINGRIHSFIQLSGLGWLLKIKRKQAYTVLRSDVLDILVEGCSAQECR